MATFFTRKRVGFLVAAGLVGFTVKKTFFSKSILVILKLII